MSIKGLKWATFVSFALSMAGLLAGGFYAKDRLPPYPGSVAAPDGGRLFTKADILEGQGVYQRYGLMDHGSVWGHGSQRGPEFSALTLHLMVGAVQESVARREFGMPFAELDEMRQGLVAGATARTFKENAYDAAKDELALSEDLLLGWRVAAVHWLKTFSKGDAAYGILPLAVPTEAEALQAAKFFFWTAWAASAARPGTDQSYTNNWPPDRAAGNQPGAEVYLWTLGGILSLLIVLGIFIFMVHHYGLWFGPPKGAALAEKLVDMPLTPSQFQAAKFFLVVILLFLLQTVVGGLLAHYTAHPASFYLPFVAELVPYSWAKSWHLQLAVFWIATTWVASAIYLAPIIGGTEPKGQSLLVKVLLGAILLVAVGSLTGEALSIKGLLGKWWYWLGHQGWEYLELGRLWQILLFGGLIAWLLIVYRAVGHHLGKTGENDYSGLVGFYVFSAILVVAFFGFGLMYGKGTHLSVADYWRWFVVHIWVESVFEFFGVGAISLLLVSMGLASARSALIVGYFTAIIVFLSGILGTAHHYFWYGGPSLWLAVGSVFSSMEPVPLFGLVTRGLMEVKTIQAQGKEFPYKWPLYFLVASSFWNFLGAGVFGFLINLPLVNYYEHGTYLTMNHGHAALFGVYGMLSIGLLLFSWRGLVDREHWNDRLLKVSFWGLNGGLALMTLGTLFPVGLVQAWISFRHGLWLARDASFFDRPLIHGLSMARIVPDTVIIVLGVLPLAWFLLSTYRHLKPTEIKEGESLWKRLGVDF
ncbi:MAG: cbb3-type cytochrome c oxidase subunit I [Elusimicrobia bacterium]|nr:cbb3-type cytochrome c oxidase subunit I [Elusimicrobiota bacterium]